MRITFERLTSIDSEIVAEFDVETIPTKEQCEAIEDEIFTAMGEYELEDGDCEGFDFWGVCYVALKRHVKIITNPVVKTFYI